MKKKNQFLVTSQPLLKIDAGEGLWFGTCIETSANGDWVKFDHLSVTCVHV